MNLFDRRHECRSCALIVSADDQILAACESCKERGGDAAEHSELCAVRIASREYPKAVLSQATLYTSTEPCAMCAGAIYWGGIGRLVYGLPEARPHALTGNHPDNPTCRFPAVSRSHAASGRSTWSDRY